MYPRIICLLELLFQGLPTIDQAVGILPQSSMTDPPSGILPTSSMVPPPAGTIPPSSVAQQPSGIPSSSVLLPAGIPSSSVAMPSGPGEQSNPVGIRRQASAHAQVPPSCAKPAPLVQDKPNPSLGPAATPAPSSSSSRATNGRVDREPQVTAARSHYVEPSRSDGGSQQTGSWRAGWRQGSVGWRTAESSVEQRGRREDTGGERELLLFVRRYGLLLLSSRVLGSANGCHYSLASCP